MTDRDQDQAEQAPDEEGDPEAAAAGQPAPEQDGPKNDPVPEDDGA